MAILTQQQKEAQDEHIQKLIREHAAAREDCCKAEAAAAQARRDASATAERAEEAEWEKDEVRRQLAQDPMTTLKHVGDLMEIQQNDAKRARCDVHI